MVESPIDGLTKVISINEVRKLFSAYKDRKKLLSEHTHFICDANVMAQLYNLLGKTFADRNNSPIPINFKSPSKLQDAIMKACSASYMHMKGQTITVRIGLSSMTENEVIANALEGLAFAVSKFKGVWGDVRSIHLKLSDSPALPIYSKLPSELLDYVSKKGEKSEKSVAVKAAATAPVSAVKGKKSKVIAAAVVPAVVVAAAVAVPIVAAVVAVKSKGSAKKPTKKEIESAAIPVPEPEVVSVPVVVATPTVTATPGKKRGRPAKEIVSEDVSEPEPIMESASKIKKIVKKVAKKA